MFFFSEQELNSVGLKYIPTELWLHIFKMEHRSNITSVHQELKNVFENTKKINSSLNSALEIMDWIDSIQEWTPNQLIAIATSYINEQGEEDINYMIEANY